MLVDRKTNQQEGNNTLSLYLHALIPSSFPRLTMMMMTDIGIIYNITRLTYMHNIVNIFYPNWQLKLNCCIHKNIHFIEIFCAFSFITADSGCKAPLICATGTLNAFTLLTNRSSVVWRGVRLVIIDIYSQHLKTRRRYAGFENNAGHSFLLIY